MKKNIQILRICALAVCFFSSYSNANFRIDYQGLDKEKASAEKLRLLKGAPDGYRLLTDKGLGFVHQVGTGKVANIDSFGADFSLQDAISLIMPNKWIAYIDENISNPRNVDWQAKDDPWVDILGRIGASHGYRFVVDWDQKLLQIAPESEYTEPDYDDPIELKDPESGRTLFVYSAKPISEGGVIIVDGQAVKVKLVN